MKRTALFILGSGLFVLSSCGPAHRDDIEKIDSLRTDAEQLIRAQSEMGWNSWAFGAGSNQDSLYRAYPGIFTKENLSLVDRAEREEEDSLQRKRLRYLKRYLTTEYIGQQIAALTDSVSNLEAAANIVLDGKTIPYRQVPLLMASEKRQDRRAALYMAVDPVLDSLNPLLLQIEETNQRLAKDLGYQSYNGMVAELKDLDLDAFRSVCERVLDETTDPYKTLLKEILSRTLGLTPEKFYRYDVPPLFRAEEFDRYFPADSMLSLLRRTYLGMGIDIGSMKNLHIDDELRERKNPRAVCFPVDVPNDVRLSIKPIGGPDDYLALFHEAGHGLHYANTGENALEFKYLGEPTVTETYAFLSEYMIANQSWLRLHSRMPTDVLKDFVRYQAFHRLYFIRRYSAKFLYELRLHSGDPSPETAYRDILSRGTSYLPVPSDGKRYLTDLDAFYYSAGYLRAWFLEAQLNAALTERFGVNWFENPNAGTFLLHLWKAGDRLDGDELAASIGYEGIRPDELLADVNRMLLFSTR